MMCFMYLRYLISIVFVAFQGTSFAPQIFRFVNERGQCHFLTPWEYFSQAQRSRVDG